MNMISFDIHSDDEDNLSFVSGEELAETTESRDLDVHVADNVEVKAACIADSDDEWEI